MLKDWHTWTERPRKGDTLLSIFYEASHIRNIIGTGPSSCCIHCIRTHTSSISTLYRIQNIRMIVSLTDQKCMAGNLLIPLSIIKNVSPGLDFNFDGFQSNYGIYVIYS